MTNRSLISLGLTAATFLTAAVVLGCQPADETPGLWLDGNVTSEPVDDWRFTNLVEEIFIETRPWYFVPHSTTIWCVEHEGDLYVGSYGKEQKTWEKNVAQQSAARLAIAGKLYEVDLTPVTEPGLVDALDAAYTQKYDMAEVFGEEIPAWWYYRVTSRS